MPIKILLDEIETAIKDTLDLYTIEAREKKYESDYDWTYYLKEALGELGQNRFGCKICASGFKGVFEPEWMYDLVWYKEEGFGETARLVDVPLVVESEWNKHFIFIKYDFEKLLVANASHRLFVCYVYIDNREKIIGYFKDAVEKYRLGRTGDRFMIAILDYDKKEFFYELIIKGD